MKKGSRNLFSNKKSKIGSDIISSGGSGGGGDVTIVDQITSATIATITAPGSYPVLQFSGIDGGASNTTYTNSIIST